MSKQRVEWLLDQIAEVNPYNRVKINRPREFYMYQLGFVASMLADIILDDPYWRTKFNRKLGKDKRI